MDKPALTVGDLFCGAGGFSEGFRQAGFKINWAYDNWKPAYETFRNNFPGTEVITEDIMGIDFEKEAKRLKPVHVIIGSPPCQPFSLANRGGNGNTKRGLELVAKFLEAVKALRPKYWIMENVPNIENTLRQAWVVDSEHFDKGDVRTFFPSEMMRILDSSHFGVPQKRRRLFSGNYPAPLQEVYPAVGMQHIITSLPYPEPRMQNGPTGKIQDPLYSAVVPIEDLRDHFMKTEMDAHNVYISKKQKRQHRWAGKMRFPDPLDLPSRTICATSTKSGRQSIVIDDPRKPGGFRVPSIRECASLQGFPLCYQFWGATRTEKQTLVGNAVPPPVARALAISISREMGLHGYKNPAIFPPAVLAPEVRNGQPIRTHKFPLQRPFRSQVPGTYASCRVDFDNQGDSPRRNPGGIGPHLREWRAVLYLEYAREYVAYKLDVDSSIKIARVVLKNSETLDSHIPENAVNRILRKTIELSTEIPDASSLQAIWADRLSNPHGPDWILRRTAEMCRSVVGEPARGTGVQAKVFASYLKSMVSHGDDFKSGKWRLEKVNSYTALAAVALSAICVIVNEGTDWLRKSWGRHYIESSTSAPSALPDSLVSKDSGAILEKAIL